MWRAAAGLTDKDGREWLAFAEGPNIEAAQDYLKTNITDGQLRKRRKLDKE